MATTLLTLKIDNTIKEQFQKHAKQNGTTASALIKNFIYQQIHCTHPPQPKLGRPVGSKNRNKMQPEPQLEGVDLSFLD